MIRQRVAWCLDLAGLVILTWQALPSAPTFDGEDGIIVAVRVAPAAVWWWAIGFPVLVVGQLLKAPDHLPVAGWWRRNPAATEGAPGLPERP